MFLGDVFMVYVDGIFVGICENEDEICDVAQDSINGIDTLLDDDYPDRVSYDKINVNRWYFYDEYNCSDRLSDANIMCYDYNETLNCVKNMNRTILEHEREEARLRALLL